MHHALTVVIFIVMFLGPCLLASSFERREREQKGEHHEPSSVDGLRVSARDL